MGDWDTALPLGLFNTKKNVQLEAQIIKSSILLKDERQGSREIFELGNNLTMDNFSMRGTSLQKATFVNTNKLLNLREI